MAKIKKMTAFFCQECGYESAKWYGMCPSCHAYNSMVEAPKERKTGSGAARSGPRPVPRRLDEISTENSPRIGTGSEELDRVLGGGILPGSLILTGGDPGIGKSTLLLQVFRSLAAGGHKVLYISGEESLRQLKLRADRIGKFEGDISFRCETDLDAIEEIIREEKPEAGVIDSIQTMSRSDVASAPGSPAQVRECTNLLLTLAKSLTVTIFIVGHVTKDGTVAGPRLLEHMVDTVLYFEGDRHASYRILRAVKNRFGATGEIGVFEMTAEGLTEVPNPSAFMLNGRPEGTSGSVITGVMEGTRPLLLEVQALITRTNYGTGRRTAAGLDYNRVSLLLAVMEKRLGLSLSDCDAYVNITGGLRVNDPSLDLAVVLAMYSSYRDLPLDPNTVVIGEVGLAGEIRAVPMIKERVQEAARLGFSTAILPKSALRADLGARGMRLIGAADLGEAIKAVAKE